MTEETNGPRQRAPRAKQPISVSTNPDALLTVDTVAALCGCRPDTVRDWVRKGSFPKPLHIGRGVRWPARIVNDWMRARQEVTQQA